MTVISSLLKHACIWSTSIRRSAHKFHCWCMDAHRTSPMTSPESNESITTTCLYTSKFMNEVTQQHCNTLYLTVLHGTKLYHTVPHSIVAIMYYAVPHSRPTIWFNNVLNSTAQYCTVLHYIILYLYCTVLHYIILYCTVLYFTWDVTVRSYI